LLQCEHVLTTSASLPLIAGAMYLLAGAQGVRLLTYQQNWCVLAYQQNWCVLAYQQNWCVLTYQQNWSVCQLGMMRGGGDVFTRYLNYYKEVCVPDRNHERGLM